MAKKQKEEERVFDGGEMGAVDVVGQKTRNGYEFIKNMNTEEVGAPNYIFGHVQAVVNPWVRKKRDKYNMGSLKLKESLGAMSLGTDDSSLFVNMLVYGGQSDGINIDDGGKLSFGRVRSSGDSAYRQDEEDNIDVFHLDNVNDPVEGASPIIIEPYESKAYVWNLAEETNRKKEQGEEFDEEWVSKRIAYELTNKGDKNTIGLAFADLAGDNSSKSFADQWRDGLSDSYFYTNPETGQPITNKDNSWMKDPANYAILQKYLGRYITNIMRDVHGPTINKETGQVKRTQAQIAQDIVKKYSK